MTKTLFTAFALLFAVSGLAHAAVDPAAVAYDSKVTAGTVAWYLTPSSAITQGNEIGMEPFHNQD